MSVWYCIPSKRQPEEVNPVLAKWKEMGYNTAVLRDPGDPLVNADTTLQCEYPGYAIAVNRLVQGIIAMDPKCQWFVTGGDDILPDPKRTAQEIAKDCTALFRAKFYPAANSQQTCPLETFGVMQPTGDRWGADEPWARAKYPNEPAYIDRVCGSPWMGREFCRRIYGGRGPIWPEFWHMFEDEHLQCVAKKLGILWQRRDLTHHHNHWGRTGFANLQPDFLSRANSPTHWAEAKAIFERLKAGGFAEAEDLLP